MSNYQAEPVIQKNISIGWYWPSRAKENAKLLAEKLPFAGLRDEKFRQHPQWPVFGR